jgi:hypothetical protein
MKTSREVFYDLTTSISDKKELKEKFIELSKSYLEKQRSELRLPIQLLEQIFDFDFHRSDTIKHPISTSIANYFKKNGLRIVKIRGKYVVRILKKEE